MYFRVFFKSRWASVFYVLLFAFHVQAAVTIDNTSSKGAFNAAGVLQMTWSHTVGSGASRALYVSVSTRALFPFPSVRAGQVSYGGQPLTAVGTVFSPNSVNAVEMFRMINPPTGTANIIVNFIAVSDYALGGSVSFTGVSQTTPNGAFFSASGTNAAPVVLVTDSVAGDLVFDTLAVSPSAVFVAAGANQTERWDGQGFFGNAFDIGAGSTEPAAAMTTMSWITSNPDNWALGAVAVKQFVITAASVSVSGRLTTPNGRAVSNARVTMTGADGAPRSAVTSPFGYYRFEGVTVGETYIFTVESKQFSFAPQAVYIGEERSDLDFIVK
jgi:hypothetical protein